MAAVVFIAYGNSFSNGFVWDDHEQVVMNPALRANASWANLFQSDTWNQDHRDNPARSNYYRPLQMVSYRLTLALFGPEAPSLHALSVLLHLVTTLIAFLVYLKLSRRLSLAFAAAALFAVYPIHSEAVDWISALPELGCALCILSAFGLFLSLTPFPGSMSRAPRPQWARFVVWCLSLIFFAAALLWKETAVVFPLLIATYVLCVGAGTFKQRVLSSARLSLPYWCVQGAYLLVRFRVLGFLATRQRIWQLTPLQSAASMFHLMLLYWWKLAMPSHLNAYYVFSPVRSAADIRAVAGMVFIAASGFALFYALGRAPLMTFSAAWVFVSLLPVMNIYGVGRNVFAERYLYLPSFGFCLLIVLVVERGIVRLPERARLPVSTLLLGVVVAWFCIQTSQRNRDWADDNNLFQATLLSSPDAPFVHYMVASTEKESAGNMQAAEEHYLEAIRLARSENPPNVLDLTRSYEGLTSLYLDRGDYDQARHILSQWRDTVPGEPEADIEEGLLLLRTGQWQQAEPLLRRVAAQAPQNENVWNALGLLAWEYRKNLDDAISCFSQALAIHTSVDAFQASLRNNLGGVYGDRGQFPLAIVQFQNAVAISPANAEYHANLATAMAAAGRFGDAVSEAGVALKLDPGYAPARNLLGQLQAQPPAH